MECYWSSWNPSILSNLASTNNAVCEKLKKFDLVSKFTYMNERFLFIRNDHHTLESWSCQRKHKSTRASSQKINHNAMTFYRSQKKIKLLACVWLWCEADQKKMIMTAISCSFLLDIRHFIRNNYARERRGAQWIMKSNKRNYARRNISAICGCNHRWNQFKDFVLCIFTDCTFTWCLNFMCIWKVHGEIIDFVLH